MRFNPKEAWESVRVLSGGDTSHHASPTDMRMQLPNGELAKTDAENASVFGPKFHRFFNNRRPIDWPVLYRINIRKVMDKPYQPISWDDIKKSTTKLANDKAPGLNGVPPNTFKALYDTNLSWLLLFYNQFWNSQADLDECHEGQVVPVTKKGDTTNPNKWRGVNLMFIVNKIYSSIMCGQLFKIISKHGVKLQFGSTPGVLFQDGTFKIKTLLHLRHNHNLPTWVAFADLVRAFDTSNHALLINILVNMVHPQDYAQQSKTITIKS